MARQKQFYFNPTIKKSHGRHAKSKTSFNKGSKN